MLDREKKTILVTGATGKQGGAVAGYLLRENWRVRILCRNPDKPEALALEREGAEIVRGDLDKPEFLLAACADAHGVFSVQNFWETGAERETRQGIALAEAAKDAGVKHFVYSSVGGADRNSGLPHFESKWKVEQHIREIGLPATILRPVFFMENFNGPDFAESIASGVLRMPMRKDRELQMIAVTDIGAIAALAFADPDRFVGQALEIAGDALTMPRVAELLSEVLASRVRYEEVPVETALSQNREVGLMFKWFNEQGYRADIPYLRSLYPSLLPFRNWVGVSWIRPALIA